MTITTPEPTSAAPAFPAPEHSTLCAAFQATAAAHGERVALRTPGDGAAITWTGYAERVRATAARLAPLGVGRGDTVALLLTNRPEAAWVDVAAMHLGAAGLSLYLAGTRRRTPTCSTTRTSACSSRSAATPVSCPACGARARSSST